MYELIDVVPCGGGWWRWIISAPNGARIEQKEWHHASTRVTMKKQAVEKVGQMNRDLDNARRVVQRPDKREKREKVIPSARLRKIVHERMKQAGKAGPDKE